MKFPTRPLVTLRPATLRDLPALVALNRAAYPDLAEAEVVFTEEQLRAHVERFGPGQVVAEIDGVVVGAIATLIVSRAVDPLRPHSWAEATGDGFFTTHDPQGDTLYLADIYVDGAAWGRGVGTTLYQGLRDLCVRLNLTRIVAGGRLWGYHAVSHERTPEAYCEDVALGLRIDRVLGSQLKAGFVVRGILPSYLPDPKSCNFASLLEWVNPQWQPFVIAEPTAPAPASPAHPPVEDDGAVTPTVV